jgi:thymidylate kinase
MAEPRGISGFIDYKRKVERERPLLTIEPRLITIDGVDGVGKGTIAKRIFERLTEQLGKDRVSLVATVNFEGGLQQKRLGGIVKEDSVRSGKGRVDKIYAATTNRAYGEEIVPALQKGKIVIVDRSEVDGLRYALEKGDPELIEQRRQYLREGSLTHRLWAGNRVFVTASPEDVWENLSKRGQLSENDPRSLEEVKKRMNAEKQAEAEIAKIPHLGEVNIIRAENKRVESPDRRNEHLNALADEIIEQLSLEV